MNNKEKVTFFFQILSEHHLTSQVLIFHANNYNVFVTKKINA